MRPLGTRETTSVFEEMRLAAVASAKKSASRRASYSYLRIRRFP